MQADSSLLIVGESGPLKKLFRRACVEELEELGFLVAASQPATTKQILIKIASQLGVDLENLEGKTLNTTELQEAMVRRETAEGIALILEPNDSLPNLY